MKNSNIRKCISTRSRLQTAVLLVIFALLVGCAAATTKWSTLTQKGSTYEFYPVNFKTANFSLAGLLKGEKGHSKELIVYLEGDGRGVVRGRVTQDPTPSKAMGFELARSDPAPMVLYLARIGQFQPSETGDNYKAYWSNKRLSKEAVEAASQAIDQAKAKLGATRLHLIGYSGGGGLAILLAEQRNDVATITTVAGLLDTVWWVEEKNYQPLTGSLNPADQVALTSATPQVHFYGIDDIIIPPNMSAHFRTLAPFTSFSRVEVPTNHWNAWPELWPNLLEQHVLPVREDSPVAQNKLAANNPS